jgi:hypothetical protein
MRAGGMVMCDAHGICCSILYGQDNRSLTTGGTRYNSYVAYAPAGVSTEAVEAQLQQIITNVRLFAPQMKIEQKGILSA